MMASQNWLNIFIYSVIGCCCDSETVGHTAPGPVVRDHWRGHIRRRKFGWYERQWFSPLVYPADRIVESWFRLHRFTEYRRPTGKKKVKAVSNNMSFGFAVSRLDDLVWAPCSGDPRFRVHDVGPMSRLSVWSRRLAVPVVRAGYPSSRVLLRLQLPTGPSVVCTTGPVHRHPSPRPGGHRRRISTLVQMADFGRGPVM